jgi:hypothetical protein
MAPIKLSRDLPPYDEAGLPIEQLDTCPDCKQKYPKDNWHMCATNAIGDVPADVRKAWKNKRK